ncbi:MAG: sigma-54 dependent transcriptional regulator [Acidobacteriota bacterium]
MPRILIVDDEPGLREFMVDALETEGYEVSSAESGETGLLELRRRAYNLLITDLKMPGLTGLELLRQAREEQPELEVLVLTAHGTVETAVEAMRAGAFDYLQKPIESPEALRTVVARALERRSLLDLKARQDRESHLPQLSYGDPKMEAVIKAIRKVAPTDATVLLEGESGTGKELAAQTLHAQSARRDGPFVALNCAAIADTLLESELFGHEKGAFTGATTARRGRLELAAGGTFFLDEIGELKVELQAKLLRVLQEREFERVGGNRAIASDVRWIAATNRDLEREVAEGRFREDLFHRIAVFPIELPPLRDRRQDIPHLTETLLHKIGADLGRPHLELTEEAADAIFSGDWPGNVRELSNALERAAILSSGPQIAAGHLSIRSGAEAVAESDTLRSLDELEREAIARALASVDGNRRKAAEQLGIGLRTLYDKLKKYELS